MNTKMLDDAINGIRPELIEKAGNINQHELKNNDAFDGVAAGHAGMRG